MKKIYRFLLLTIFSIASLMTSCKKDRLLDVRDFGRVSIDSASATQGPSDIHVYIYGKNLPYLKSEVTATLNGKAVEVIELLGDRLMLHIPGNATSGDIKLHFDRTDPEHDKTDHGNIADTDANFKFTIDESLIPKPLVTAFTPKSDMTGNQVTITGYNFATGAGQLKVLFGTTEAQIISVSRTSMVVTVPTLTVPQNYPLLVNQGRYSIKVGDFGALEPPPVLKAVYWPDNNDGSIKKAVFSSAGVPTITTVIPDGGIPLAVYLRKTSDTLLYYSNFFNGVMRFHEKTGDKTPIYDAMFTSIIDLTVSGSFMICIEYSGSDPNSHYIMNRNAGGVRASKILYELPNTPSPQCIKSAFSGSNKIYWSESTSKQIVEGNASGSTTQAPKVLFDSTDGLIQPFGIAIDETAGEIYITDGYAEKACIYVGNLDGSGTLTKLPVPADRLVNVTDLELDPIKGVLYWASSGEGLLSCKTNGTNVQVVMKGVNISGGFDILY